MILSHLSKQDLTKKANVFTSTSVLELTVTGQVTFLTFSYFLGYTPHMFLDIKYHLA